MILVRFTLALVLMLSSAAARAQETPGAEPLSAPPPRPAFQFLRAEEDWRLLRDPELHSEPLDPLKAIAIGPDTILTLGGNLRLRGEAYDAVDLGFGGAGNDTYLLTRMQVHADLRIGTSLRVFAQVGHGGVAGEAGPLAPLQDNDVDLAQAFLEVSAPVNDGRITMRAGRQEMLIGSGRLINPRDGPNTRLTFDGLRATLTRTSGAKLDLFYTRPVQPRRGTFDDKSSEDFQFWGGYGTIPVKRPGALQLDVYYLGIDRNSVRFGQGIANEERHTFGVRVAGRRGAWDWDAEGAIQFGTSTLGDIFAYSFANDVGYTLRDFPLQPRLGLRFDMVSGDDNLADGQLGNFEIPFPKLPYLTEAFFLTPANIIDVHPNMRVTLSPRLTLSVDYIAAWKHERADAFYLPPLRPVAGTEGGGRFIGHVFQLGAAWNASPHLAIEGNLVRVAASGSLEAAGGKSSNFATLSTTVRF